MSERQFEMPWVGVHRVSWSPSQRATAERGSICALLWCLETYVSSTTTSAAANPVSTLPR